MNDFEVRPREMVDIISQRGLMGVVNNGWFAQCMTGTIPIKHQAWEIRLYPAKDGELSINEKTIGGINSSTNDMGQTHEANYMLATSRMVVSDVDRM